MASSAAAQIEALLLATPAPVQLDKLRRHMAAVDIDATVADLKAFWRPRGMTIREKDGAIGFVPSEAVIKALAQSDNRKGRKLTEAAVETLCFIAVHQPVTTRDIEEARGLALFKGVTDSLMDSGFVRTSLRKTDSGRAVTYVTTEKFLDHFGLTSLADLPDRDEIMQLLVVPDDGDDKSSQTENDVPQPQVETAFGLEITNFSSVSVET
jgi:segregation and condensation protein B